MGCHSSRHLVLGSPMLRAFSGVGWGPASLLSGRWTGWRTARASGNFRARMLSSAFFLRNLVEFQIILGKVGSLWFEDCSVDRHEGLLDAGAPDGEPALIDGRVAFQ